MHVASLGLRTDLMVRRLAGASITDCGDYIVVRTPDNPNFYWGNFLLLAEPPRDGGAQWLATFVSEFPQADHVAIAIDGTEGDAGDVTALLEAGAELEYSVTLTASKLSQPATASSVEVRRLATDDDWEQAVLMRIAVDDDDSDEHLAFVRRKASESRRLVEAGHAVYFGAVVDGQVRSSLGIVSDHTGVARYQNVETHPDYRRRGLARTLLRSAADVATREMHAETLVILADPEYVAIDLYRSLGFVDLERAVQLQRSATRTPPRPDADAAAAPPPVT